MEPTGPEPSLYTVKALLVLDSLGQRLLAKYYDGTFPTAQARAAFERSVFSRTHRAGADAVGRAQLPPRRPRPPPAEGGGEALAAGQHGGDVPGGGRDRGQGGDPGERPPASDPAAEPAGPGAGGVRLRPLRLPGRRLGAEGRGRPGIGSAEEAQTRPCIRGGPARAGRDWGWCLAAVGKLPTAASPPGRMGAEGALPASGHPAGPHRPAPKAADPLLSPGLMRILRPSRAWPREALR
ncbi:coatomer subunit zeta-2 isoform 1-T1 [Chlamydotis macqueenii]